ncbi:MAG TPA: hypothetical protein VHY37_01975 [Tepidisphaeraceae bacterium]|jgi:hypothetical protein|nr:hypothetical protein [Tepidisphaeraceae bacterium]
MATKTHTSLIEAESGSRRAIYGTAGGEKERIYRELDCKTPEQVRAESRPLSAEERRRLARFRRGFPGRPKVKEGAKAINVTVEQGLLRRADSWAKGRGMTRAQLIARGLQLAMAGNGTRK